MAIFGKPSKKKKTSKHKPKPASHLPTANGDCLYNAPPGSDWMTISPNPHICHAIQNPPPIPPRPSAFTPYPSEPLPYPSEPLPYQTVFVQQNYLLPPPTPYYVPPQPNHGTLTKLNLASVPNFLSGDVPHYIPGAHHFNDGFPVLQDRGAHFLNQSAALYDRMWSQLDNAITLIDNDRSRGDENDVIESSIPRMIWRQDQGSSVPIIAPNREIPRGSKGVVDAVVSALDSDLAKVNLYANSKLPSDLPPFKIDVSTYQMMCLAAQFSESVYEKPKGAERETHVNASWRSGTKAMIIKSVPIDDRNIIVFAIRGTATFLDWAVNFKSGPASPIGFLDDPGNLCHTGFLQVARSMIQPVATRLRALLAENPSRSTSSLLITGHSAGGAVAALLYSHMLSTSPQASSELRKLTGSFKRIHCVTFGAPPISLLPQKKPAGRHHPGEKRHRNLFFGFVNEGDLVPRVDVAYVKSLLDLCVTPPPGQSCMETIAPSTLKPLLSCKETGNNALENAKVAKHSKSTAALIPRKKARPVPPKYSKSAPATASAPVWPVPPCTLTNAGKLVLLRSGQGNEREDAKKMKSKERLERMMQEGAVAQMLGDELLRGVVWGDLMCHEMCLYRRRIEVLATNAILRHGM